jgi:DNA-binding HxlR family transcriptional regulator
VILKGRVSRAWVAGSPEFAPSGCIFPRAPGHSLPVNWSQPTGSKVTCIMIVTCAKLRAVQRKSFSEMPCPIAQSLEQIGEAWCLLILRDVFLGVRRFQDLERRLGIAPSTLTRRLGVMCERGLLTQRIYAERPTRHEYFLTPKGEDLLPVLLALGAWGNRWLTRAIVQVDPASGRLLEPVLIDRQSGRVLDASSVALAAGPDAQPASIAALTPPRRLGAAVPTLREVSS